MEQVLRAGTKLYYMKANLVLQIYLILPFFLVTCFVMGLINDE